MKLKHFTARAGRSVEDRLLGMEEAVGSKSQLAGQVECPCRCA